MIQKISNHDPPTVDPSYHRPNDPWVNLPTNSDDPSTAQVIKKPSLRTRRRNFTAACTAFTIGTILILCYSPFSNNFIVPGPLSSHHSPLLATEGADRCAACHANADGSMASWIASTLISGQRSGVTQSELCMKCHDQSMVSQFALNPHNVDPNKLATRSKPTKTDSFDAGLLFHAPVNESNQIACSVCHQEHHGDRDMQQLTDAQCQTCHSNAFHSFEQGHPEFANYPSKRRSRIAFDHSTHSSLHFPAKQEAFRCNQCHIDDHFQNVKQLASYEQSCAACHHQQIINSGQQGLAILSLPMIDTDAIEAAKLNVGSWPLAATGDFDGRIPAMMRVMLAADPQAKEIFQQVGADFEFSDVDPTNPQSVEQAVELIWAIKRLFHDLAVDGPHAVRSRLEQVLGFEISDQQLQQMISNLDEPVFENAVRRWLPDLPAEMAARAEHEDAVALQSRSKVPVSNVAWRTDQSHTPDHANQDPSHIPVAFPVVRVPKRNQQDSEETSKWARNAFADPLHDPELLAINPLTQIFANSDASEKNQTPTQLPEITTPALPVPGLIGEPSETAIANKSSSPTPDSIRTANERPPLILPNGWFRNDQLFEISYRPSGHADPCIQNWIELVAQTSDADTRLETKRLFEKTIATNGVGLCRTCHTLDQKPDRSFTVNWRATYRDPSIRSFTRFAHGPHLLQPELQDCSHCHALDPHARNAESFLSVDTNDWASNFVPIRKTDCASCHQKGRTGNGCTQCHNYHVGSKVTGRE